MELLFSNWKELDETFRNVSEEWFSYIGMVHIRRQDVQLAPQVEVRLKPEARIPHQHPSLKRTNGGDLDNMGAMVAHVLARVTWDRPLCLPEAKKELPVALLPSSLQPD